MRAETGPMEFKNDWRGVFIRGDNALLIYVPLLKRLMERLNTNEVVDNINLGGLIEILSLADQDRDTNVQKMELFQDCIE